MHLYCALLQIVLLRFAIARSINDHEVKPLVNDYEMMIVDECHHVSAETCFECILIAAHAKYVYGLTATPKRSDGHLTISNIM